MSTPPQDPRIFFAAERTLLAWIRTGITIMALGFVISRFGLFVELLAIQSGETIPKMNSSLSVVLGLSFVIIGALAIVFAAIHHKRFIATVPNTDLPKGYQKGFAVSLSILIGFLGVVLAVYLLITGM